MQELKEILAKQAELGVEVADIPPEYLSYSEKHDNRKQCGDLSRLGEVAEGASTGKEKSRNRFNKRKTREKESFKKERKIREAFVKQGTIKEERANIIAEALESRCGERQKPVVTSFEIHGHEFFLQSMAQ